VKNRKALFATRFTFIFLSCLQICLARIGSLSNGDTFPTNPEGEQVDGEESALPPLCLVSFFISFYCFLLLDGAAFDPTSLTFASEFTLIS